MAEPGAAVDKAPAKAPAPPARKPEATAALAPTPTPAQAAGNGVGAREAARPTAPIELKGKPTFDPSPQWKEYIALGKGKGADVDVRFGNLAAGTLQVRAHSGKAGGYSTTKRCALPLTQPLLASLPPAVQPVLAVEIDHDKVTGHATVGEPGKAPRAARALSDELRANASALGMVGFELPKLDLENKLQNGRLEIGTKAPIAFKLAGWLDGTLGLKLVDESVEIKATVAVRVKGLADGTLELERSAKGELAGVATINAQIAKLSGTVTARYVNGDVTFTGTLSYTSEKFKGSVTVMVDTVENAQAAARGKLDPQNLIADAPVEGQAPGDDGGGKKKKGVEKGLAAWGELDFAFTDWLTGKAQVVIGPTGYITVVGKIAPPKSVNLLDEKPWSTNLLDVSIEAAYGLPVIGNLHVGIGVALGASARLGPATLSDMVIEGTYSTDPAVLNNFSITGAFRISAYAGLNLAFKGYVGITLLKHHVNFGAKLTGTAGIKGYAEARPTIGFREKADPAAGKKGEYYLKGHLEIAAQPFLGLGGELYVELDSPWWSPAPDKTWTWPLFSLEYPLPGEFGIAADVDYVIGSGQWPEVKFGKADFDASKFADSLLDRTIPDKKTSGDVEKAGKWKGEPPPPPTAPPAAAAGGPPSPGKAGPTAGSPTGKPGRGGQSAEDAKAKPVDEATLKRFSDGMDAIDKLHATAERDPETADEIHTHLAAIKSKFGFTKLQPVLVGDYWEIDAELNPKPKKKPTVKADPKAAQAPTDVDPRLADVPGIRGGAFTQWFNSLTLAELDQVWAKPALREKIEDRLRHPGGMHEWHMVSRAPTFKLWKLTAEQIWAMRSAIAGLDFVNPEGSHGKQGSTEAHNEILAIIDSSIDYNMFKRRLQNWATYRLKGGEAALPSGLRP